MQLINHLEHTRNCMQLLLQQPYINDFFSTKINHESLIEHCNNIIDEINNILELSHDEISHNYEKYIEYSYSFFDFYETLSAEASMFASSEICSMFTLNSNKNSHNKYFNNQQLLQELKSVEQKNYNFIILDGDTPKTLKQNDENLADNILNFLTDIISMLYDVLYQRKQLSLNMINDVESILTRLEEIDKLKKSGEIIPLSTKLELLTILERIGIIFLNQDIEKILLNIQKK